MFHCRLKSLRNSFSSFICTSFVAFSWHFSHSLAKIQLISTSDLTTLCTAFLTLINLSLLMIEKLVNNNVNLTLIPNELND